MQILLGAASIAITVMLLGGILDVDISIPSRTHELAISVKLTSLHDQNVSSPATVTPYEVPNIVHYIWYHNESIEFRLDKALGVLSVSKNIKPDAIYFHTNMEPKGKYYDMMKKLPEFQVGDNVNFKKTMIGPLP